MIRVLALVVTLAACRIPGDHFIGMGGGDDAGDDGSGSGSDAAIASSRGYIIDDTDGVYRVSKNLTTGALTYTSGLAALSNANGAILNPAGTHLFVTSSSGAQGSVTDYSIATDGTLSMFGSKSFACAARGMRLQANGRYLLIGCASADLVVIEIGANGTIDATTPVKLGTPPNPPQSQQPVFALNNTCIFALSSDPVDNIVKMTFNSNDGTSSFLGLAQGPNAAQAIAVHPSGNYVYVASSLSLATYAVGIGCNLQPLGPALSLSTAAVTQVTLTFSPNGTRLYATANGIFSFDVAGDGAVTFASPTPSMVGTTPMAVTMDPSLPDIIYLTQRTMGTMAATILSNAMVAPGPMTIPTGAGSTVWFTLAP